MDGIYIDHSMEGCEKCVIEKDYSSPLYTLSLLKKQIEYANNLIITLEQQLTKS